MPADFGIPNVTNEKDVVMRQKYEWTEMKEFTDLAAITIAESPDRYGHIESSRIAAYASPTHPTLRNNRAYEVTVETEPERVCGHIQYFVRLSLKDWETRSYEEKRTLVTSVLDPIRSCPRIWK